MKPACLFQLNKKLIYLILIIEYIYYHRLINLLEKMNKRKKKRKVKQKDLLEIATKKVKCGKELVLTRS